MSIVSDLQSLISLPVCLDTNNVVDLYSYRLGGFKCHLSYMLITNVMPQSKQCSW